MRAEAVVGSNQGQGVTVVERECRASDRLDTRREAEVTVVWGRGTADGEAKAARCAGHTSSREHAWVLLVNLLCCVSSNSCCSCLSC